MSTPWDQADTVKTVKVDGQDCYWVSTPSHGGIMIPIDLAAAKIPAKYRDRGFVCHHSGFECYEEDLEWASAVTFIPQLLGLWPEDWRDEIKQAAADTVKWMERK